MMHGVCMSAERALPVTINEMLLRGCMLKNSNYVLGMVVYTGRESRIQMNAATTPNKVGARMCRVPVVQPPVMSEGMSARLTCGAQVAAARAHAVAS